MYALVSHYLCEKYEIKHDLGFSSLSHGDADTDTVQSHPLEVNLLRILSDCWSSEMKNSLALQMLQLIFLRQNIMP